MFNKCVQGFLSLYRTEVESQSDKNLSRTCLALTVFELIINRMYIFCELNPIDYIFEDFESLCDQLLP